jgi:hypothetical protein
MKRRQVLAAAGVGAAGLLAGCNRGGDDDSTPTPQGQWELRGSVVNRDDSPREWLVSSRSESGGTATASGTIPGGEEWEFALLGQLSDERLEVHAESDNGATSADWRPAECRLLAVEVTISDGNPSIQPECREGGDDAE